MDKFTASIVFTGLGTIAGFLFGAVNTSNMSFDVFKGITQVTYTEARQMKNDCEAELPRNRVCVTELIVREVKE